MELVALLMGFLAIVALLLGLKGVALFFGLAVGLAVLAIAASKPDIKGTCPYCGTPVTAHSSDAGVDCPGCKKRLLIRDKKLIPLE